LVALLVLFLLMLRSIYSFMVFNRAII
jgi:hypothetical protein